MRQKTDGLTKKQKEVLDFIKKFYAKNKYPPSIRQICSAINLSSPATVHVHINHLVEKGYIKRSDEGNKAIELLVPNEYDNVNNLIIDVPVLRDNMCTNPIDAIEKPNELVSLPTKFIPKNKEIFTFYVDDVKMMDKEIHPGDKVIAARCNNIRNGEKIIYINQNNEFELRTFYKDKIGYKIEVEKDNFIHINISNITILGKVIGLYRMF